MKKYLQYRRGYLCIWLLLCSVPILVQLLYGQALESILYGVGLATVLVLLFMVHDFLQFREKEEKRKQIAQNMGSRELCLFDTKNPVEKSISICSVSLRNAIVNRQNNCRLQQKKDRSIIRRGCTR